MNSYLSSYFNSTATTTNRPTSQPITPGGTSTWGSTFSSRIATLRKALTKDSEEDDPDNEDCSHLSNVLRAYYTEKGRGFPEWLPPDPKRPMPPPLQSQVSYGQYGNQYPNQFGNQQPHSRGPSGGRGGGLADLWETNAAPVAAPPQSLRAARPTPASLRSNDSARSQSNGGTPAFSQPSPSARPLPSQRAGSYQTAPAANAGAMGSRDRLRARLQGGGSGRSSPSSEMNSGSQGSYGASGGSLTNNPPARSGLSQPYISASQPWATDRDPYTYNTRGSGGGSSSGSGANPYANQDYRQRPGGPR